MFGAHFPLDVLAGTALGTASALAATGVVARAASYLSSARNTRAVSRSERNELSSPA